MNKMSAVLVISVVSLLAGCGNLYRVKVHDPTAPTGIPFFSNVGACTQQTVYANPYYLITLKVTGASGILLSDGVKLSSTGHRSVDFQNLIAQLDKEKPDSDSVKAAWELVKRRSFNPYTESDAEFVLSNTSKATTVVDYAHQYSLNERRPLVGSVSADYKLSPDGTLSEAQGQIQDTTLASILGVLPLSDLIKSAAGIATKVGAAAAQNPEVVHFSLEQEERMRTTTYSVNTAYSQSCPTGAALTSTTANVSISLADVGAKDTTAKTDASKNDSSIGITGTINLPKALLPPSKTDASSGNVKSGSGAPGGTGGANTGAAQDTVKKPGK
jgi:hypothetical protein